MLAAYSPRRFVEEILVERVNVGELVVGYDHHFGKGREGNVEMLKVLGRELGFGVDVVGPVGTEGDAISSTKIRNALLEGDVETARKGLGRPYSLRGLVVRGDQRGRTLGFPTANLEVRGAGEGGKLIPQAGIYAVRGTVRAGTFRRCASRGAPADVPWVSTDHRACTSWVSRTTSTGKRSGSTS